MSKNKTATAIALFLVFAMAASAIAFQSVTAQQTGTCATYAFIGAVPNPVGVGQETLLHIGITTQLVSVQYGWEGLSVTIEKPDGTTETISNIRTDSTGGTGRVFVPSMAGNYTFQTHFPEQLCPATLSRNEMYIPKGTLMKASVSEKMVLVVQSDPLKFYPGIPMPSEFWTRPINAQFREWYSVSGSSWMPNDYNDAPEAPHVLWTKPLTTGGLVGGTLGEVGSGATSVAMENGDAYEGKWATRLILAGRLYYNDGAYDRPRYFHCVDLRTGEEYWKKTFLDNRTLSEGQLFYWESYNYQGTFPYLWVTAGSTWYAFDPYTGEWMTTLLNVPSGTTIRGPRDDIYRLVIDQTKGWMAMWNMSGFISWDGSFGSSFALREYNVTDGTYRSWTNNGTLGDISTRSAADRKARAWSFNVTIPTNLEGRVRGTKFGDSIFGNNVNRTDVVLWRISLKPGHEGQVIYNKVWDPPADWETGNQSVTWGTTNMDELGGTIWAKELRQHYAFNLETGTYLWKTASEHYLDIYDAGRDIYQGKLISVGQAGTVYCYDWANGNTMWTYAIRDPYTEILWSNNWPVDAYFFSDGKLYFIMQEHSGNQPLARGAPALCLNATTGAVIWRVDGLLRATHWGGDPIMGDSVLTTYNTYDQQVYAVGKGPSATTVAIKDDTVTYGDKVLVQGFVTDISPGTKQTSIALRFPNGVPAVSDASQGEWMKYVYAQFPRPSDATGVEVVINVLDPNNNYYEVGRTTADEDGFFKLSFDPQVPGDYTVVASFGGSASYYGSHAKTAVSVTEARQATTPEPTTSPQSIADQYFVPATVGLFAAIAVVGAILALMMRRK